MISAVALEQQGADLVLNVQFDNGAACHALLCTTDSRNWRSPNFAPATISNIREILDLWKANINKIAESYIKDRRNLPAFLFDVVFLAYYVSLLPNNTKRLFNKINEGIIMHNRIIAQIIYAYSKAGYEVDPVPRNLLSPPKIHDFNIDGIRCDVKTILPLGKIEHSQNGKARFTKEYRQTLLGSIRNHLEEADKQVGKDGIVFFSAWSYKTNAILREYFVNKSVQLPPPQSGNVIFVLSSPNATQYFYVALALADLENTFNNILNEIEQSGVGPIEMALLPGGLPIGFQQIPFEFEMD